jgi:hypothetical protein
MSSVRMLYGGAIQASFPVNFEDVSGVREIPDHQEVYLEPSTETSIIIELLDMDTSLDGETAARNHFLNLAHDNESQDTQLLNEIKSYPSTVFMPQIEQQHARFACIGTQAVKKYRSEQSPVDLVLVVMVLVRLGNVGTDVLITMNIPIPLTFQQQQPLLLSETFQLLTPDILCPPTMISNMEICDRCLQVFPMISAIQEIIHTFTIQDWSLFL